MSPFVCRIFLHRTTSRAESGKKMINFCANRLPTDKNYRLSHNNLLTNHLLIPSSKRANLLWIMIYFTTVVYLISYETFHLNSLSWQANFHLNIEPNKSFSFRLAATLRSSKPIRKSTSKSAGEISVTTHYFQPLKEFSRKNRID